jgi:hypothetical protein
MGRLALPPGRRPQRFKSRIGSIAYGTGPQKVDIPNTDYLTGIDLISKQTVTSGGTVPVVAGWGAFGPLGNIALKTPGNRAPISMPAYHMDVLNRVWQDGYSSQLTASPLTINTTTNWKGHIRLPIVIDPVTDRGAYYVGDSQLNLQVALATNLATTAFSTVNGATIAGSWDVWAEKFNAPAPDQVGAEAWLDAISFLHTCEVSNSVNLSNGTTQVTLPTEVDYLRIILIFYTGNNTDSTFAPADGLYTSIDLVANEKFHLFEEVDEDEVRFDQLQVENTVLPPGTAVLDFVRIPNSVRDVLPSDGTRRMLLKIKSTSANNKCDVILQYTSDSQYADRWFRQRAAQGAAAAA